MAGNSPVSSHPRSTSGCFGTSGRVSDWPQDFGGQGGVVAGADSTPGSYYLSASPGALACSAGLAGQRLAGRAEPPAPRRKGGRRRAGGISRRARWYRVPGSVPGQSATLVRTEPPVRWLESATASLRTALPMVSLPVVSTISADWLASMKAALPTAAPLAT